MSQCVTLFFFGPVKIINKSYPYEDIKKTGKLVTNAELHHTLSLLSLIMTTLIVGGGTLSSLDSGLRGGLNL